MEPRTQKALYLLAGAGLLVSAFLPIGDIETPWPPFTLHAWAWMEPFVWPLILVGAIIVAGALLENVRPVIPAAAFLLGSLSVALFLGTIIAGRKALYDQWFPGQIGPANMLEFHFWILAIHFGAMLAAAFGGLYAYARRWQMDHSESLAPPDS